MNKRLAVLSLLLASACGPKATECPTPAGSGCVPAGFQCTIASPSQTCTCTNGVLICRAGDGG